MDSHTKEEYQQKRIEIIDKFTQEFMKKSRYNPLTVKIIECLIRDENPYAIIEILINNQEKLIEELHKAVELTRSPQIILKQ
ncbi:MULTISPECIES: hypothetical protein [Flavobacterium]|uniref:Uncharacterized protein n=3 Tax=Flavobacterium columnare TaxID=996 RepID=A0AA94JNW0_9FLAO|nr:MULTISPECIES: hypothetical protein [Flavobacterium]MCH4828235.1 hypothetical protein [Flavobacterium columnare]MCH4829801.1 hypothetical protein [Flavobacterium columnare]MCH4831600.1 hypothetical protein [Flavobacterium columnare]MCH4831630.1 hypothetical protein [Flavobacterium columnare]MCH4831667.1 hypothetical protein [Flavobacterium columnare]